MMLAALSLLSLLAPGEAKPAEPKKEWDMTTFTLVLVRPGTSASETAETEAQILDRRHASLLRKLAEDGKVLAWGPIEGSPDLLEDPEDALAVGGGHEVAVVDRQLGELPLPTFGGGRFISAAPVLSIRNIPAHGEYNLCLCVVCRSFSSHAQETGYVAGRTTAQHSERRLLRELRDNGTEHADHEVPPVRLLRRLGTLRRTGPGMGDGA